MKKLTTGAYLALSFALIIALTTNVLAADTSVVYNSVPNNLPPNMASLGFEATATAEVGEYVNLVGENRNLKDITITMSNWATHSQYPAMSDKGYKHPITLNVYSAIPGTPLNKVGALLGSVTQTVTIPWRPVADPTCPSGTAWRSSVNNQCYNGLAFNVTFNMSKLHITLPDDVIIGVAYNTSDYGVNPLHVAGPYNSLNVGLEGVQTVGSLKNSNNIFWNTTNTSWYTDGGVGGSGVFREDTVWSPYIVPIKINASESKEKGDSKKGEKKEDKKDLKDKDHKDAVQINKEHKKDRIEDK